MKNSKKRFSSKEEEILFKRWAEWHDILREYETLEKEEEINNLEFCENKHSIEYEDLFGMSIKKWFLP